MEQIECGNASGISLPEAFLYSLLTPTQVLRRLIVVEDVNQQAPAVFYNADVTVEAGVRDGVHASLHHNLTEGEVHHVSCLSLQRFLRGVHRHCGREAIGAVAQCQATVRGDTVLLHRVGVGSVDGCLTICGCCGFGSRLWRRGRLRSIFRRWGAVLIAAGLGRDGGRGDVLRGCRFCDRLRVLGDLWNILLLSPFLHGCRCCGWWLLHHGGFRERLRPLCLLPHRSRGRWCGAGLVVYLLLAGCEQERDADC